MKSLIAFILFTFTLNLTAQETESINISLTSPGKAGQLHASLISGSIKVSSHSGNDVLITAVSNNSTPKDNKVTNPKANGMKKIKSGGGFNIIAEEHNNTVEVSSPNPSFDGELQIKLPKNFSVQLATINDGDLTIENVEGSHELSNVNGDIVANKISGSLMATTVNGDINVTMNSVTANSPLAFTNLNGDIEISLPATAKFNVQAASDNGDVYSDFEVQTESSNKKITSNKINGEYKISKHGGVSFKINNGGPDLMITSMNGDIMIKKI